MTARNAAGDPESATRDPKQVIQRYLDALLAGDIDTIRDSFAEHATWRIHGDLPLAGPWIGRDRIVDDFLHQLGGGLIVRLELTIWRPYVFRDTHTEAERSTNIQRREKLLLGPIHAPRAAMKPSFTDECLTERQLR